MIALSDIAVLIAGFFVDQIKEDPHLRRTQSAPLGRPYKFRFPDEHSGEAPTITQARLTAKATEGSGLDLANIFTHELFHSISRCNSMAGIATTIVNRVAAGCFPGT